jgi:molecular chaperone DnaJ
MKTESGRRTIGPFGMIQNVQECPKCDGSGQEVEEHCFVCKGKGSTADYQDVALTIPAGVDNGATLRVKDGGHAGKKGGRSGDLFVQITVKPDPKFRREGNDIYTESQISYLDAILGTTVKVDTLDGPYDVRIPAGTQPDQKLRLKGKGATKLGTTMRGDSFVTVKVTVPTASAVTAEEKSLLEQLAELRKKIAKN